MSLCSSCPSRVVRRVTLAAALLSVVLMSGCSDSESIIDPPADPFPVLHLNPVWVSANELAFEDIGARDAGPGWWRVDEARAGVVIFNFASNQHALAIPHGSEPSASTQTGELVAQLSMDGSLIAYADSQRALIPEARIWTQRVHLALSTSSRYLAWRSFGNDAEVGIWIFERDTGICTYVGAGSFPIWNPIADRLMYRSRSLDGNICLVEYDCASAARDTVFEFGPNEGSESITYSPSGTSLAFFRVSAIGEDIGLCIVDMTTKTLRQVIGTWGDGIAWGARGIAYSDGCGDSNDPGCGVLWLLDPITGTTNQITHRYEFTR